MSLCDLCNVLDLPHLVLTFILFKKIVSISPNRAFEYFFVSNLFFLVILDRLDVLSKMKKHYFDSFQSEKYFEKQLLPQTLILVHKKKPLKRFLKKWFQFFFHKRKPLKRVEQPLFFQANIK